MPEISNESTLPIFMVVDITDGFWKAFPKSAFDHGAEIRDFSSQGILVRYDCPIAAYPTLRALLLSSEIEGKTSK